MKSCEGLKGEGEGEGEGEGRVQEFNSSLSQLLTGPVRVSWRDGIASTTIITVIFNYGG